MGELKNKAKQQSKFLKMDMNESVIVKYVNHRFIPSHFDPKQDTVQYEFEVDGSTKYWTNGSTYVMLAFDDIPKGSLVTITRKPLLDKNENVIEGKSKYLVEPFEEEGQSTAPPPTSATDDEDPDNPF